MPITFGSVGDIISVSLLIKEVLTAVSDSRGSSAEYQAIFRELLLLDRALLQIEQLSRDHQSIPELTALYLTARNAVEDCRNLIGNFIDKIKKYQLALGQHPTSNLVQRIGRKALWITEKDDVTRFRAAISAHTASLNMLIATASVKVMSLTESRLHDQADAMIKASTDAFTAQSAILSEIQHRLDENNQLLASNTSTSQSILSAVRLDWLRDLGGTLKGMMQKIIFLNMSIYRTVLSLESQLPNTAERSMTFLQEPVIFEDAIGRIAPVHVQLISTWALFDAVLTLRFEGIQGFAKVRNKEYVLECRTTRRDISRDKAFDLSFLPGQRVDMSFIFNRIHGRRSNNQCPRCRSTSTFANDGVNKVCDNKDCRTFFRHVEEVESTPIPGFATISHKQEYLADADNEMMSFKRIRFVVERTSPQKGRTELRSKDILGLNKKLRSGLRNSAYTAKRNRDTTFGIYLVPSYAPPPLPPLPP